MVGGRLQKFGAIWFAGTVFLLLALPANAISLRQSIEVALEANPQVGEAIANREAIEFELRQAVGQYLPKVDLQGRYGAQNMDNPTTRASGTDDDVLERRETDLVVNQSLFEGFKRRAERHKQASRVDGASHRVYERSESLAVNVVREYLEVGRALQVVELARQNVAYHENIVSDLREGTEGGSISVADRQQAEERVFAAQARVEEAIEDLNAAKIRFFRLVGMQLEHYQSPPSVANVLPPDLNTALNVARQNNPSIKVAEAELDAATAQIKQARSEYFPKLSLELRGRNGHDLDGVRGRETDFRAELVARWNLFNGGIDRSNVQEQLRRADQERFGLRDAHRQVEEQLRLAWERRNRQARRLRHLEDQLASVNRLSESYSEQFQVGERSLLDLLDTQNTRFNTQVAVETARSARMLEEYRILAATGTLLQLLNIEPPKESDAYARDVQRVPATPEAETRKRILPDRGLIGRSLRHD